MRSASLNAFPNRLRTSILVACEKVSSLARFLSPKLSIFHEMTVSSLGFLAANADWVRRSSPRIVLIFVECFIQKKSGAGSQYWGGLDNSRPHASQRGRLFRTLL